VQDTITDTLEVAYRLSIGAEIDNFEWPWTALWPLFFALFHRIR